MGQLVLVFAIILHMSPEINGHEEIKKLLVENQRLLIENNQLLRKMHRTAFIGNLFRVIWFVIVIGLPAYFYFSYVQPNLDSIKERINTFEQMTSDTNVFKDFYEYLNTWKAGQ